MTAYDDLASFQFKAGKGYERRSVEEFRARSLNILDELMRANVQLKDGLAAAVAAPKAPTGPILGLDEQDLLDRYRGMSTTQRYEVLQRLDGRSDLTPPSLGSGVDHWGEPAGWADEPTLAGFSSASFTPLEDFFSDPTAGAQTYASTPVSWELPTQDRTAATDTGAFAQPDWLSDWESAVPETPAAPSPFFWDQPTATTPADVPTATLPAFMPPPQPFQEVTAPVVPDAVKAPTQDYGFQDSVLSQGRLEDLFNQLDFGPPSVELVPHATAGISDVATYASPLHVGLAPTEDQPLPPPVRPWEGWIQ